TTVRGIHRRGARMRRVPVPSPLGTGGDRVAAAGHTGGLPRDGLPGREREHHVAWGHCDALFSRKSVSNGTGRPVAPLAAPLFHAVPAMSRCAQVYFFV